MLKISLLSVLLLLSGQQSKHTPALPSGAEFPPQDQQIWWLENQGLTAKLAIRRLSEAPDSPETVRLLAQARNLDGALQALRTIVEEQPRRMPDAFEALRDTTFEFRGNDETTVKRAERLAQIVADARKRLPDIPREEAARAERVFITLDGELTRDRKELAERLGPFVERYRGTEAALLAEVDVITSGRVSQQMFDALDAFIESHPGTNAAAKALYMKGFQWHTINTLGTLEPRGADPTDRFMRVLAIVKELESGRHPPSEWVTKAPSLITGFFFPQNTKIPPANVERLVAALGEFAASHFDVGENSADSGMGYVVTSKIVRLFERPAEGMEAVERALDELERSVREPEAVRYLRASFYMQSVRERRADRDAMLGNARDVLRRLSTEGAGHNQRKALATLASLDFQGGKYAEARDAFRKYATTYPESNWTWVAWLRAGQCEQELGNTREAVTAFLQAVKREPDLPLARVLGHEYAARAHEAAGDFANALTLRQRALADWDPAFGLRYSTFVRHPRTNTDPFAIERDVSEVTKESLPIRIAQLQRSLQLPDGALFERGRWLVETGRYNDARAELRGFLSRRPKSILAREARDLMHRAQLEYALQLADAEQPSADEAAAMKELDALAAEPLDFAVTAARIARASLLWKKGDAQAAETMMNNALTEWHAAQRIVKTSPGLEQDVADIRSAVFLPSGGGVYGAHHWNAFSWAEAKLPFLVVNADVRVKESDGDVRQITLAQPFGVEGKVLSFDTQELSLLKRIIVKFGGTKRREPRQIMETPNQPIGDSMQLIRFWSRFFHARPGHWGGWEVETYPVITEIQFTNPEHTKAAARVTIGYSGATVELEKEAGKWIAKRLTNQWIT